MIKELRQLGVGAHVAGMFMGVACYADDVVLIAGHADDVEHSGGLCSQIQDLLQH